MTAFIEFIESNGRKEAWDATVALIGALATLFATDPVPNLVAFGSRDFRLL